jgi:plasmid stability protein
LNAALGADMGMMTVRNIPDNIHDALRAQAKTHGRSTEAEVRAILSAAVKLETDLRMGDALAALGREIGLTDDDVETLDRIRDKTPAEPMRFD